ncbi:Cof-type HAD-IIB family hydrolase [[Mycoplasma] testudinis]|uniref:Cof-type HAD-IIB family hydrolase n=1 Tax=[Mycoplasma] testudinis TaxID=33924 RepID=UPI0004889B57|nr:Cof-type HAD-IIB family hydrolase [[Mycoplasma] testudinis]
MKKINISNIKYAYFDMDGTLLNDDLEISQENVAAINILQKSGVKIGIATGRSHFSIEEAINKLKIDLPIINNDGAEIYDAHTQKSIVISEINSKALKQIVNFFSVNQISFASYGANSIYICGQKVLDDLSSFEQFVQAPKTILPAIEDVFKQQIVKVLTIIDDEQLLVKTLDNFKDIQGVSLGVWRSSLLIISVANSSKWHAFKYLEQKGLVNRNHLLFIGDNNNDALIATGAKYGVMMDNAKPELKNLVNYFAGNNNTSGVATFINTMIDFDK